MWSMVYVYCLSFQNIFSRPFSYFFAWSFQ